MEAWVPEEGHGSRDPREQPARPITPARPVLQDGRVIGKTPSSTASALAPGANPTAPPSRTRLTGWRAAPTELHIGQGKGRTYVTDPRYAHGQNADV